jgi:hypothetical protein
MTFEPINISQEELEITSTFIPIRSIAISEDSKRVYFGQNESYDRNRLNLSILSLDDEGEKIGTIRRYINSENLPFSLGDSVNIMKIIVSSKYQKLYLAFNEKNIKIKN